MTITWYLSRLGNVGAKEWAYTLGNDHGILDLRAPFMRAEFVDVSGHYALTEADRTGGWRARLSEDGMVMCVVPMMRPIEADPVDSAKAADDLLYLLMKRNSRDFVSGLNEREAGSHRLYDNLTRRFIDSS